MKYRIVRYEEIDSTNLEARRLSWQGAEHGTVVIAEKQTAGKGRRGRTWESPQGKNLYFTILLKPNIDVEKIQMLTIVMAYSVARVVKRALGVMAQIKWPNDIVLSGKKVCGILTEMHMQENRVEDVLVGVGINVNIEEFPSELQDKATSIYLETKKKIDREALLKEVIEEFHEQYLVFLEAQELSFLQEEYNSMLVNKDKEVVVLDPYGEYNGVALGINTNGELLVEKEDNRIETVFSGEVSVRGLYGYV